MELIKRNMDSSEGLQWFMEKALPFGLQQMFGIFADRLVSTLVDGVLRGLADSGLLARLNNLPNNSESQVVEHHAKRKTLRRTRKAAKILTRSKKSKGRECSMPGCDRDSRAKGLCMRHYQSSRYWARKNAG